MVIQNLDTSVGGNLTQVSRRYLGITKEEISDV
jgi:hypothetical protein